MYDPASRKDANNLYSELEKYAKKTCAYFNKKYIGNLFSFSIKFFIVDDYVVVLPNFTLSKILDSKVEIPRLMSEAFDNYVKQLPSQMTVNNKIFKAYILSSLYTSNEHFIELLSNSYSITIPTSTGKDLNIVDDKSYKDFTGWLRTHAVWYFRRDDGPPLITDEDDCYIYEYIMQVLHYV